MEIKIGETYDLIGHKGKTVPVQIRNESTIGGGADKRGTVYNFTYLDNSKRPDGICRASELRKRENSKPNKLKSEASTKSDQDSKNHK